MSLRWMDADTAETVAGVMRLLRRAAQLAWQEPESSYVAYRREWPT